MLKSTALCAPALALTLMTALALALAPAASHAAESLSATALATSPSLMATPDAPAPLPMSSQVFAKLPTVDPTTALPGKLNKPLADGADIAKDGTVWDRIRSGYAIPDVDDQLVAKHVNWYASRPDYIARTTTRASRYIYHVVEELEKRGMPTELALLPFIESAFNPNAMSSANAAGMWQFVPATGRDFNLKQNMFKDERRGVLASTDAALTYLQRLYDMFGDWQLVLAAYNWGEGSVQKAIKKNQALGKPTDFESLADLMPAETRNYVPKLQAVKNIIANPAQYGVTLPNVSNQPYFTAVDKTSDIDLTIAAQLAELSLEDFKALNPQFNRPVITGDDKTKILLPQENVAKFTANLANWGHALSTWTTLKITSARERIETLASKFGTTPDALRQANNIPQRTMLKVGSTILVPKTSASLNVDIAPQMADNATMSFEAERAESGRHAGGKVRLLKGHKTQSSPVALVKPHVPRAVAGRRHRSAD
jgi:membrane-bound lytic murein transglycosylase D